MYSILRKLFATGSLLIFLIAIFSVSSCKKKEPKHDTNKILEVDFETSMGKGCPEYNAIFVNPDDVKRFTIIKSLYDTQKPSLIKEASRTPRIPKIIHQIWLGPKVPPTFFATFQKKWKDLHPGWEYHLWTEPELDELNLSLKEIIDDSPNYAEKSDIIRCELLDRFGGVYLDVDMDPHGSLDELHEKYDFYAGLENPHRIATTDNSVWLGISIMASCPGHPVMKRWKELIQQRWYRVNQAYSSPVERVINHTYFPFSYAFFEKYKEENKRNIVFPATYFYPLAPNFAAKRRSKIRGFREYFYDFLESMDLRKAKPFSKIYPESIAVHYWGNTWLPSQYEQMTDIQNQIVMFKKELYNMQQQMKAFKAQSSAPHVEAQDQKEKSADHIAAAA